MAPVSTGPAWLVLRQDGCSGRHGGPAERVRSRVAL